MKDLKIFENNEFGEFRISIIGGEPYFSLNDVCRVLEVANPRNVKVRLNGDGVHTMDGVDSLGRRTDLTIISDANLYKLVFQSRKPETDRFADWVNSEVLPAIRKHGAYMTDGVIERTLTDPDYLIMLAINLKEEKTKKALVEAENERNKPKVLFADSMSASSRSCLMANLLR